MSRKLLLGLIALALIAAACGGGTEPQAPAPPQRFVPQVVDFLSDSGRSPSLALDKDGLPHLAYLGLNQKLGAGEIAAARPLTLPVLPAVLTADLTQSGIWEHGAVIETENMNDPLPLKKTDQVALAVDPKGNRDAVFTFKGDLQYATAAAGSAFGDPEKIASGSVVGLSIAAAPDGTPWVTWLQGHSVMAATKSGKSWNVQTVASIAGRTAAPARTSVQASLPDSPSIVFTDAHGAGPTLAQRAGNGWETQAIDPGAGGYGISLALDTDGNPHVAYYTKNGEVRHAHSVAGSPWEVSTVGHGGSSPDPRWNASIGLDKDGVHYIAWYDHDSDSVHLSSNADGDFKQIEVNGTENGTLPQVAVPPDGENVYVAWYDEANADLVMGTYGVNEPPPTPLAIVSPTAGASPTGPAPATCEPSGDVVTVVAENLQFDTDCLAAPAKQPFEIDFENKDATPHNFAVYDVQGGDLLFGAKSAADTITGPAQTTYKVSPEPPGEYFFQCDVHPTTMIGTFVIK